MDDVLKKQTQEVLTKAQNIMIAVSASSGFDGLASGLSLYLSIQKLNKNLALIAKNPTVGDAQMLYGVNKIGTSDGKKDLIISISKAVENVEKVTHFLDGDELKIVIHALQGSKGVEPQDIFFKKASLKPNVIIAIGYENFVQLKNDITQEHTTYSDVFIISVNCVDTREKFAQINIHEHEAVCLSEVCANLIEDLAIPIDSDIAFNLYTGMSQATQMFAPNLTKPSTLDAAQFVLEFGAGNASLAQTAKPEKIKIQNQNANVMSSQSEPPISLHQPNSFEKLQKPIENIEKEDQSQESWLKPPKIYHGSKSFDSES